MPRILRQLLLPVFQRINIGDISISHHWTSDKITLHSFKHKGYWYYGKDREQKPMEIFARIIRNNDCVLDIGGHIGYTTLYFSYLVGATGQVFVFEPSPENLQYLCTNVGRCRRKNIRITRKAVSDRSGVVTLTYESVTGQNSSIVPEFAAFSRYCKRNHLQIRCKQCSVDAVTIDEFVTEYKLSPRFIKIDIEGAELQALLGARRTIGSQRPCLMVEINLNADGVRRFMSEVGYSLYTESGDRIMSADPLQAGSNVFAFHECDNLANSVFPTSKSKVLRSIA